MTMVLIILTIIIWGITPIFDKAALKDGEPFAGVILRNIIIGLIMGIVALFSGKFKDVLNLSGRSILFFTLSGLFAGCIGVFTYFKVLQFEPTSKIVPLVATYPLITALLSVTFLGEAISISRLIGTVLIITGIWLVK